MSVIEEQIISLEEEVAHLRVHNEELSTQVLAQWKEIENLQKHFKRMEERFADIEDGMDIPEANVKPPHW